MSLCIFQYPLSFQLLINLEPQRSYSSYTYSSFSHLKYLQLVKNLVHIQKSLQLVPCCFTTLVLSTVTCCH